MQDLRELMNEDLTAEIRFWEDINIFLTLHERDPAETTELLRGRVRAGCMLIAHDNHVRLVCTHELRRDEPWRLG